MSTRSISSLRTVFSQSVLQCCQPQREVKALQSSFFMPNDVCMTGTAGRLVKNLATFR